MDGMKIRSFPGSSVIYTIHEVMGNYIFLKSTMPSVAQPNNQVRAHNNVRYCLR